MHRRSYLSVVAALGMAGLLFWPGCSDSSDRAAGRELMESIRTAQRLSARAGAMLANVVLKVNDDYAPVFAKVRGQLKVTAPVGMPVNPKAVAALKEAESLLRKAIGQAQGAPKETLDLARQTLANVLRMKGSCGALQAAEARQQLLVILGEAEGAARAVREHLSLQTFVNELSKVGDADLERLLADADTRVARLEEQVEKKTAVMAEARSRGRELEKRMLELNAQARDLRTESNRASGERSLELFDQAQELERKATALLFEAEQVELKAASLEAEIAELQADVEGARMRQGVAREMLAARRSGQERREEIRGSSVATLEASVRELEAQDLPKIADLSAELATFEKEGLDAFDEAANALKAIRTAAAEQAAIAAAAGDLRSHALPVGDRLRRLGEEVGALWRAQGREIPEAVGRFASYAPQPEQIRAQVAAYFEEAAKLYQQAARSVGRQQQWIYQAGEAGAYLRIARLQRDAEALQKAREAVQNALEGRREAPLLRDAVRLEGMIETAG